MHRRILSLAATAVAMANVAAYGAEPRNFSIPPGELAPALESLAKETGLELIFQPEALKGIQTQGVTGKLSPQEAVSRLIKGARLIITTDAAGAILIAAPTSASVTQAGELPVRWAEGASVEEAFRQRLRLAQAESSANPESQSSDGSLGFTGKGEALEEIVVTAEKRSASVDKVPISIVALNSAALDRSFVKNISDVATLVPGIQFDSSNFGPGALTNISIRGINSTSGASTTGVSLDDVPIQSRVSTFSVFGNPYPLTFDLDRVEVLRGPQGTLLGAGAEGGSVRFILKNPSLNEFSGRILAGASTTERGAPSYEIGAAGGGPLVENVLGFRASLWHRRDGGYVDHVDPLTGALVESDSNHTNSDAARLAVALSPSAGVTITPSIVWQRTQVHDAGSFFEELSDVEAGQLNNGRLLRTPLSDSFYAASVKVEAGLGFADLTSVTSYFDRSGSAVVDSTSAIGSVWFVYGLPMGPGGYGNPLGPEYPASYADAAPSDTGIEFDAITQELRLASTDPTARFTWLTGLYFSRSNQTDNFSQHSNVVPGGIPVANGVALTRDTRLDTRETQWAGFGQVDFKLLPKVKLTAGLRVAPIKTSTAVRDFNVLAGPDPRIISLSASETPLTPRYGIEYQIDPRNLVYLSMAKGYRAGGPNIPTNPTCASPGTLKYDSDSLWNYELGQKSRLFDDRLQISTSVFRIKWSHLQQLTQEPGCSNFYTTNVGEAISQGFDLSAQALLGRSLKLQAMVSYTDAQYSKDSFLGVQPFARDGDATGLPPQVISPWNATVSAEYAFALGAAATGYVRVEDTFHSRNRGPFISEIPGGYNFDPVLASDPSMNIVNASANVSWSNYEVSLFVNNLTDRQPVLGRHYVGFFGTLMQQKTLRPRTVGVNLTAHLAGRP